MTCPCGCGEQFAPAGSRGRERSYFSPACSLRVNNFSLLNAGAEGVSKKDTQLSLLNAFYGRRHSAKTRRRLSEKASVPKPHLRGIRNGMSGRTGPSNPNYKDGSSPERQRLYSSGEWKEIIRQVYARDGYGCTRCDKASTGRRSLHAHHIKSWAEWPALRFELANLTTLCRDCHHDEHRKEVCHQ